MLCTFFLALYPLIIALYDESYVTLYHHTLHYKRTFLIKWRGVCRSDNNGQLLGGGGGEAYEFFFPGRSVLL